MKIEVVKSTSMQLAHASESVIKSIGLCSVAWYEPTEWKGFLYKITFYNRHAPVNVSVDLISVSLDCPHVRLHVGDVVRDDSGRIAIVNQFLFACPKTSSGTYMMGFNPKEMAQRYINTYLTPTVYASDDYFVKLIK